MSDTDSFIEEVSEEIRRDRLFKLMKRYGWIPILLILLLVGGAAYNEWQKSQTRAAAQSAGDQILAALQIEEPLERGDALNAIEGDGEIAALLALLASSEQLRGDDKTKAADELRLVAGDPDLADTYRHLAEFKLILMNSEEIDPQDRIARLEALAAPGAPYRLLAEEQIAVSEADSGNTDGALKRLTDILGDGDASAGLRRRVSQLIVALGGQLDPA